MSVDILMYEVQTLTNCELNSIRNINVNELDELCGWELKTYSTNEISDKPERFTTIKQFLQKIELMCTRTNYKACFTNNGMPADISSYSMQFIGSGCIVRFNNEKLEISSEELDKYTTTIKEDYYIVKRKHINADVEGYAVRTLMEAMEKLLNQTKSGLGYSPILLDANNCEILCKTLVDLYDEDELYPNENLSRFTIELLRAIYKHNSNVFIEFQD